MLALTAFLFSAYLLVLQLTVTGAVCDWCVVNDAIATVARSTRRAATAASAGSSSSVETRSAIRGCSDGSDAASPENAKRKEDQMHEQSILNRARVEDVMHEGVVTCGLHAPMTDVARKMAANRIHCVVVWNEPSRNEQAEVWGVVSDLDLVKMAANHELSTHTAGACAATPALIVAPDEPLLRAAQLMAEHEVAHLVVVDPETVEPVGVLSTLDLAYLLGGVSEPALA
jgi:CBS domain-containing protein